MKTLVGFVALTMLLISTAAFGQQQAYPALSEVSYGYFGSGARAFAMGDAFVGLADDVNSGTWNPAGIWVIENPMVSASYLLYLPESEYTDSWTTTSTLNSLDIKTLGNFSFATPIRIKGHPWVFDFNYNRNNEYTVEADLFSGANPELNPDVFLDEEGFLRTYNFGFSTRIYKQFSFGFTINIYDGRRIQEQVFEATWDSVYSEIPPISTTKHRTLTTVDSTASNGLNFTLGLMNKTDLFNIGLVAYTPFKMRHDSDIGAFRVTTEQGLPLIDESDTIYVDDNISKQDIPLSVTLGLAVFPAENLTATLDANYQNYGSTSWYSRTSTFYSASGDRNDIFEEVPIDWNNTFSVGAGLEYLLNSGYGRIPLRVGIRMDQIPQPKTFNFTSREINELDEDSEEPAWLATGEYLTTLVASDRQNSFSFSVGTGIHWSQIELDLGYRYRTGAKLEISETVIGYLDENRDGYIDTDESDNLLTWQTLKEQTAEEKTHEFRFTFIGHF